jgi:hypothetical protein
LREEPQVIHQRFARLSGAPLFFAALSLAIAFLIINYDLSHIALAAIPVYFSAIFTWRAISGLKPVEVTVFMHHDGEIAFKIYRPFKAPWDYEEFIATLRKSIIRSKEPERPS